VPVRVMNVNAEFAHLKPGSVLANLQPLDVVEESRPLDGETTKSQQIWVKMMIYQITFRHC